MPKRHHQIFTEGAGGTARAVRTAQDEAMPKTSWWVPKNGESLVETDLRLRTAIPAEQHRMQASRFGTILRPSLGSQDAPSAFTAYRQALKRSLGL